MGYSDIYPLYKGHSVWSGKKKMTGGMYFAERGEKSIRINGAGWLTNISHDCMNPPLLLTKRYDPNKYHTYENYDAIESKTADIPRDYYGVIGVPITYMNYHCPEQFEVLGMVKDAKLDGKRLYTRVFIRRKVK